MNFSIEITMKTDLSELPKVKDVYITMLPGNDYKEVANKATELVKSGFNPVPHFPAPVSYTHLTLPTILLV